MLSRKKNKIFILSQLVVLTCAISLLLAGCAGTAMKRHQEKLGSVMGGEYHIPQRPVDRHYIGCPWSKQFGPIEDLYAAEIRIKKERSLNSIQEDFAVNAGIGLGGQSIVGPMGEVGIEGGSADRAKLEGVEIISPVSLADIPFEPEIPYITEALRLKNFRLKKDKATKAGINVSAGAEFGTGTATAQIGTKSKTGTEGEGLVVAYKLHTIDLGSYDKNENTQLLPLDRSLDFPEANIIVKAKLHIIEPGSGESLPRNILWACDYAEAKSRDIVAAWVVDIKPLDPRKRSLSIGFPGYPEFDGCQNYSGVIYSKIDPLTDKIHRQKINIAIIDAKLSDTLKPVEWDCRISLINESFNIKLVSP
ncbi:MAG: hypothetical protein KKI12_12900 [Proteobacteria bacterium]|nr:hypothetical protein [Pseudomonadota bacterium]MBU4415376.1 hypothetical protein [Pseudomonadota bacterium]MCG2757373.1 hypothetical protein [Desulfobacteraceae bacterium]